MQLRLVEAVRVVVLLVAVAMAVVLLLATHALAACSGPNGSCGSTLRCCQPGEHPAVTVPMACRNGCKPVETSVPPTTTPTTRPPSTTSTTVYGPQPLVAAPYRPDGCDLSLRWPGDGDALAYCDLCGTPHTCSQYERDVKEWALTRAAHQLVLDVEDLCPQEAHFARGPSALGGTFDRLGWPYEARVLCRATVCAAVRKPSGGGIWMLGVRGNHYQSERKLLAKLRACLLGRPACASRLTPDQKHLLDLNADCTGLAGFQFGPLPAYDPTRAGFAPFDSVPSHQRAARALDTGDLVALEATHAAHAVGTGVSAAHLAYEARCGADEACLHFRLMKPFSGACDAAWTPAECETWRHITHVFHGRWVDAQRTGSAAKSREADSDHNTAHVCLNDAALPSVIFSCAEHPQDVEQCAWGNGVSGRLSCREFLPILRARLGL